MKYSATCECEHWFAFDLTNICTVKLCVYKQWRSCYCCKPRRCSRNWTVLKRRLSTGLRKLQCQRRHVICLLSIQLQLLRLLSPSNATSTTSSSSNSYQMNIRLQQVSIAVVISWFARMGLATVTNVLSVRPCVSHTSGPFPISAGYQNKVCTIWCPNVWGSLRPSFVVVSLEVHTKQMR